MTEANDVKWIERLEPVVPIRQARYWCEALAYQAGRVLAAHAAPFDRHAPCQMEEHFLLIAANKACRWLSVALSSAGVPDETKERMNAFVSVMESGTTLRNLREHDDEYDTGIGRNRGQMHVVHEWGDERIRVDHGINITYRDEGPVGDLRDLNGLHLLLGGRFDVVAAQRAARELAGELARQEASSAGADSALSNRPAPWPSPGTAGAIDDAALKARIERLPSDTASDDARRLGRLSSKRRVGDEHFHLGGEAKVKCLADFWRWSVSDLVSNATRGRLAEFIVAQALAVPTDGVRDEWAVFDLETQDGIRVEVKSAGFVQSWHQNRLSSISFDVKAKRAWDAATNRQASEPARSAHVYVFALHAHQDKTTIDPLDLSQWAFYAVPTRVLNERKRSQHSITLRSLDKLAGPAVGFDGLGAAVEGAAAANRAFG